MHGRGFSLKSTSNVIPFVFVLKRRCINFMLSVTTELAVYSKQTILFELLLVWIIRARPSRLKKWNNEKGYCFALKNRIALKIYAYQ